MAASFAVYADDLPMKYVNANNYDPKSTDYNSKSGYDGAHEIFSGRDYRGASFDVETDGPDTLIFKLKQERKTDR